jgi:hypothetical protein
MPGQPTQRKPHDLSPWSRRGPALAVLAALAVAAIWLIDQRAMLIQAQHGWNWNQAEKLETRNAKPEIRNPKETANRKPQGEETE